jgi:hypothetical protein
MDRPQNNDLLTRLGLRIRNYFNCFNWFNCDACVERHENECYMITCVLFFDSFRLLIIGTNILRARRTIQATPIWSPTIIKSIQDLSSFNHYL